MEVRYKCYHCYLVFRQDEMIEDCCPSCGEKKRVEKMCPNDHPCICTEDVHAGIMYCELCGKPTCPCGSEDVGVTSRVTGYLSDVKGWNASKQQELKDRVRYNDIT